MFVIWDLTKINNYRRVNVMPKSRDRIVFIKRNVSCFMCQHEGCFRIIAFLRKKYKTRKENYRCISFICILYSILYSSLCIFNSILYYISLYIILLYII